MLIYRRWLATFIFALLAVALLLSTSSAQVRADSSLIIPDVPGASVHSHDDAHSSMSLLIGTATATRTPAPPFVCQMLWLSDKRLSGNQFRIDIHNDNSYAAVINRVQITWSNIPAFAQMGLVQMSLDATTMWFGSDPQVAASNNTTTDTDTKPGNPPFSSNAISNRSIDALGMAGYAATFNGPPLLSSYVTLSRYAITFSIDNPLNPSVPCILTSPASIPTATVTPAGGPSPSPTPTPDCASNLMTINFNSFDNFGIVRFDILSQRNVPSTLKGFNINWQKYVNSQRLAQVSLGAPPDQTGAVLVWDANDVNQDTAPPTNSHNEGAWLTDYTVPAGLPGAPSITPIYFDFGGIYRYDDYFASTNPHYGGASDFNFSTFEFTCGTTGGGTPTTQITPQSFPTPTFVPTRTPTETGIPVATNTPTSTPTATYTASATLTPSKTVTPAPSLTTTITITRTPTPTPISTLTPTETSTSTPTPIVASATPTVTGGPSPTPDCASNLVTIKFNSFDNFGIVRFDIYNQRNTTSTLTGFNINWQKYVNSQRLRQVSLGALPGQTGAVVVWDSGDVNQDPTPPTNSHNEGIWLTNFTLPAGSVGAPSITPIYFDFEGIYRYDDYLASTNPRYGGASDFNFSTFEFTCGTTNGGTSTTQVTPDVFPTPTFVPTLTPTLITPTSAPNIAPQRNFFTTHTPTLTWNQVTWATGYKIQISTDQNFSPVLTFTKSLPVGTLAYTTDSLANDTYYWRVMALGGTVSNWSIIGSFVISDPEPEVTP